MRKMMLAALIFLLLAVTLPTFPNIPKVSATTTEDWVTPALPEDVPKEPMPDGFTTEDYLDTTNPYSKIVSPEGALWEVDDPEGPHPLHVLVFGDEEERGTVRYIYFGDVPVPLNWKCWAQLQLERGDDALAANFGIDIRILGFEEWDSDDKIAMIILIECMTFTDLTSGMNY